MMNDCNRLCKTHQNCANLYESRFRKHFSLVRCCCVKTKKNVFSLQNFILFSLSVCLAIQCIILFSPKKIKETRKTQIFTESNTSAQTHFAYILRRYNSSWCRQTKFTYYHFQLPEKHSIWLSFDTCVALSHVGYVCMCCNISERYICGVSIFDFSFRWEERAMRARLHDMTVWCRNESRNAVLLQRMMNVWCWF